MLSLIFSTIFGAVAGFVASRAHERMQRRERLEGIAAALRADIARIRSQLGEPKDKYTEFRVQGTVKELPRIHSWTEGLIVEAAHISPHLVAAFMELERELHNFETNVSSLREAVDRAAFFQGGLREAEARGARAAVEIVQVGHQLKDVQQVAELFHEGGS